MIQPRSVVDQMTLYSPGKSLQDARREAQRDNMIKLASNESLWGPSPQVIHALEEGLKTIQYYPQVQDEALVKLFSAHLGVTDGQVLFGNGADEILRMVALTYVDAGQEIIFPHPSFSAYQHAALLAGAQPVPVPLQEDGANDLREILARISSHTRVVYLCAPNNPTGSLITIEDWEYYRRHVPAHILTVVDAAYWDFVELSLRPHIMQSILANEPVMMVGTFSKLYALAGLRIGWAVGPEEVVAPMRKTREPFSLNCLAAAGALAALKDAVYYDRVREETIRMRQTFQSELSHRHLTYFRSQTNFVTFAVAHAQLVSQRLLEKGFVVRSTEGFNLPGYLRVTMAPHEIMQQFLGALDSALA